MSRASRATALTTGAVGLALSLALTGCGSGTDPATSGTGEEQATAKPKAPKEGPTGTEALKQAKRNFGELTSISVHISTEEEGQPLKLDAHGSLEDGGDFELVLTEPSDDGQSRTHLIGAGKKLYLKAAPEFYKDNLDDDSGEIAERVGDKFLDAPAELAEQMSLSDLVEAIIFPVLDPEILDDAAAKGKLGTFEGMQVYGYPAKDNHDDTTLYVTAGKTPQFAGLEYKKGGEFLLEKHDHAATEVEAPPADEVVSLPDVKPGT